MSIFSIFTRLNNLIGFNKDVKTFKVFAHKFRRPKKKTSTVILVENRRFFIDYIALLAFLPVAVDYYESNVVVYEMCKKNVSKQFKSRARHFFSVLKKIAHCKFLFVVANNSYMPKHQKIVEELFRSNLDKQKIESFSYRGILLGDFIYDFYLRKFKVPTLNLTDINLKSIIYEYLQYTDEFFKYFAEHQVKAVIVSHSTYGYGIPARIAALKGIDAFLITDLLWLIRIRSDQLFPQTQNFVNLPEKFSELTPLSQEKALIFASERMALRLKGKKVDLTLNPSVVDWDSLNIAETASNEDGKKICLIALHDFVDAAHRYGNNFYPDFWEWILGIGNLTKNSNVFFLLKPHPNSQYNALKHLTEICRLFPQFKLISGSTSNSNLINKGVSHCLTVHGHIASEMASQGVITINAGRINPHMDYDFSLTPSSKVEFESAIQNMDSLNLDINLSKIYEFYFTHHLMNLTSWIIPEIDKLWSEFGTSRIMNNSKILDYYLSTSNKIPMECLHVAVTRFLNSNDMKIERRHFSKFQCTKSVSCICEKVFSFNGIIEYIRE